MVAVMIVATAMVTLFAVAQTDKSTDDTYTDVNNTINATAGMTQSITSAGTGFVGAMILLTSILVFFAAILIFRKGK